MPSSDREERLQRVAVFSAGAFAFRVFIRCGLIVAEEFHRFVATFHEPP
jgi:hypothetical protein